MDIKSLLPSSHVILGLAADSRRQVWERLCAPLVEENIVTDADAFLADLERREQQVTTRISPLVALPHARSNYARRLGVVVGLAGEQPIVYAPGEEGPRLVLLIAVPAFAPTAHLPILQQFAAFARSPARLEKLLSQSSPAQIVRLLTAAK